MTAKRLQELKDMEERGTIRRFHIIEMLHEIEALQADADYWKKRYEAMALIGTKDKL